MRCFKMAYWKYGYRKIDGRRRKVKKLVRNKKIVQVRIANRRNYTDKTAMKQGKKRTKWYVNHTDSAKRKNHYRNREYGTLRRFPL